jgi:hypothetical protein
MYSNMTCQRCKYCDLLSFNFIKIKLACKKIKLDGLRLERRDGWGGAVAEIGALACGKSRKANRLGVGV